MEQRLKRLNQLSAKLKKVDLSKCAKHDFFHNWRAYNLLRRWSNFEKAKMQGSLIDFTMETRDLRTFTQFKTHPDEQKPIDEKKKMIAEFESKRKHLIRRPRLSRL